MKTDRIKFKLVKYYDCTYTDDVGAMRWIWNNRCISSIIVADFFKCGLINKDSCKITEQARLDESN